MNTFLGAIAVGFGITGMALVLSAWMAVWMALALEALWGWFIVPLFAASTLTYAAALGLALILRLATMKPSSAGQKADLGNLLVGYPLGTLLLTAVGWIVQKFWL